MRRLMNDRFLKNKIYMGTSLLCYYHRRVHKHSYEPTHVRVPICMNDHDTLYIITLRANNSWVHVQKKKKNLQNTHSKHPGFHLCIDVLLYYRYILLIDRKKKKKTPNNIGTVL